jgi:lipoate---protein ligase
VNRIVTNISNNPWHNLALEKCLFLSGSKVMILYLWQNANTVVIGRNQNAWKECALDLMEKDGVLLARRESGGGAVFHDLGNLNFTFISPTQNHDVHKQLGVIQSAVQRFGIKTRLSGRNDIVIDENGCKFSGNAFQSNQTHSLHHGTILIDADMDKLGKYLTPSKLKMDSKGISSIKSRVCNLKSLAPYLSVQSMREAIFASFAEIYGEVRNENPILGNSEALLNYEEQFASWDWKMGNNPNFNVSLENRFEWGEIQLLLDVQNGVISKVHGYTDALNEELIGEIVPKLSGLAYDANQIAGQMRDLTGVEAREVGRWLGAQLRS